MKLIDKIKKDRILALKAKENEKKLSLSTLIGELDRKDKDPSDELVIKTIKSTIEANEQTGNLAENDILSVYLPEMFSDEELNEIISNHITENNYSGMKDMGKVMGFLKQYTGQYDGKKASEIVRNKLN
ncbi:MAG: GatB/YqeY domain-containing protein [Candidatus Muirbacterium halophilum]|nr:GatB/YqeY domain-containing protein [Candidatus Muirbacterium halophilum]